MNYILHMQNFSYLVERDNRLKPWHIALYIALFNTWDKHHFTPVFRISRDLLMNASHISSKNTFAQTIKQLHEYGYIIYQPELDKGKSPKVTVIRLIDHEIVKEQLHLLTESGASPVTEDGSSFGKEVVPGVNGVAPASGAEAVPARMHNKEKSSKQCKTIERKTPTQRYPTMKETLA